MFQPGASSSRSSVDPVDGVKAEENLDVCSKYAYSIGNTFRVIDLVLFQSSMDLIFEVLYVIGLDWICRRTIRKKTVRSEKNK